MSPYQIAGPALISFSGGRTSGYMLHHILASHSWTLPDDIRVVFANTGKERAETLAFVHACSVQWGVPIHWIEWRDTDAGFEEVGFNSASRNGEPFAALIAKKRYAPNPTVRYCTQDLKIRAMRDFALSLGWTSWINAVGLRYDEGLRVFKALARNDENKDPFKVVMPMATAKATKRDVAAFWRRQPFDLGLRPYEGNCDLCFLKSRGIKTTIIRENPGLEKWWIEQEAACATDKFSGQFTADHSMAELAREVRAQGHLFDGFVDEGEDYDVECGLLCSPEGT